MSTPQVAPIDVSGLIDASPLRGFHLRIIGLCALLIFFDGFDVQAVSYAAASLAIALGVARSVLGPIFSAGVLGLAIGSLSFGSLGDRYGRKRIFILCGLLFGMASLATALAGTLQTLLMSRFVAGLGLGGATPIALTISTDYSPRRLRSALTILMYSAFAIGGIVAGMVVLSPLTRDWRMAFYVGGAVPILLSVILALALPESLGYLVSQSNSSHQVIQILKRLCPTIVADEKSHFVLSAGADQHSVSVLQLFGPPQATRTALLWLAFFTSLVALYFYLNWVPVLLTDSGLDKRQVLAATTAGQIGGLAGAALLARLTLKLPVFCIIAVGYLLGAAAFIGLFFAAGSEYAVPSNFALGFFLIGSQYGLNAVSPQLYPTTIRFTGIGWAIGVGRAGGAVGPAIAGILLAAHWRPASLFLFAAIPTSLAALIGYAVSRTVRDSAEPKQFLVKHAGH